MFDQVNLRHLRMLSKKNRGWGKKVAILSAAFLTLLMVVTGGVVWATYQVVLSSAPKVQSVADQWTERVDVKACVSAIGDLSAPEFWLNGGIVASLDETLAQCQRPAVPCGGDACLDQKQKVRDVET